VRRCSKSRAGSECVVTPPSSANRDSTPGSEIECGYYLMLLPFRAVTI
jgi:hypothetical protein